MILDCQKSQLHGIELVTRPATFEVWLATSASGTVIVTRSKGVTATPGGLVGAITEGSLHKIKTSVSRSRVSFTSLLRRQLEGDVQSQKSSLKMESFDDIFMNLE